MENTNTRNIILMILGIAILGAGALYFVSNDTENIVENNNKEVVENILPEFGDITSFVKKDLTEDQKEDLKIILEQRKDRGVQIKDILDSAYEKGEMEEAWIQVVEIRDKCKNRILPFINESKTDQFNAYCAKGAEKLEADYVQK